MSDQDRFMSRLGRMFRKPVPASSGVRAATPAPAVELSDEDFSAFFGFANEPELASSSSASGVLLGDASEPYELSEAPMPASERWDVTGLYAYEAMEAEPKSAAEELADAVRDHARERGENAPLVYAEVRPVEHAGTGPSAAVEPRGRLLRPWKKQNEALVQMRQGFATLTDLMGTIRKSLDTQNARQEELCSHLATLPRVLEMIPEANRMQTEALKVMQSQMGLHAEQQEKLGAILDKMATVGNAQTESIESMKERVESLKEHDEAISFNLHAVGAAMASVSKNTQTSAEVLGQMKDNLGQRDTQMQAILEKQGSRFTTMLGIAVSLSVAAVIAVSVFGYLILTHTHG